MQGSPRKMCVAAKGRLQEGQHTIVFVRGRFLFLLCLYAANLSLRSLFFRLVLAFFYIKCIQLS